MVSFVQRINNTKVLVKHVSILILLALEQTEWQSFFPPSLADDDIILSTTTVILTPGQLEGTVTVSGRDDNLYEGVESVQLIITSSDRAVRFSSPSPRINVEIEDDDCELVFLKLQFIIMSVGAVLPNFEPKSHSFFKTSSLHGECTTIQYNNEV